MPEPLAPQINVTFFGDSGSEIGSTTNTWTVAEPGGLFVPNEIWIKLVAKNQDGTDIYESFIQLPSVDYYVDVFLNTGIIVPTAASFPPQKARYPFQVSEFVTVKDVDARRYYINIFVQSVVPIPAGPGGVTPGIVGASCFGHGYLNNNENPDWIALKRATDTARDDIVTLQLAVALLENEVADLEKQRLDWAKPLVAQ